MVTLRLSQEPAADAFLAADPLALLIGMLLDQRFPMERAFGSPYVLAQRLGISPEGGERLDAAALADADPDELAALFATPPSLHRFPGSMAGRVQALCRIIRDEYDNDAASLWRDAPNGKDLLARIKSLPGFGDQKARIFVALLGKQLGVQPDGWREAAGVYGEEGSTRSVADVTSLETLNQVREYKRAAKAAAPKDG